MAASPMKVRVEKDGVRSLPTSTRHSIPLNRYGERPVLHHNTIERVNKQGAALVTDDGTPYDVWMMASGAWF
ncbi:hypothetical protein OH492_12730 [Vibrio chagasii]|nr:hypothetical protein [Vibrio chagasii]